MSSPVPNPDGEIDCALLSIRPHIDGTIWKVEDEHFWVQLSLDGSDEMLVRVDKGRHDHDARFGDRLVARTEAVNEDTQAPWGLRITEVSMVVRDFVGDHDTEDLRAQFDTRPRQEESLVKRLLTEESENRVAEVLTRTGSQLNQVA